MVNAAFRTFRGKHNRLKRWESFQFFIYIMPWLIGFIFFTAGPMIYSLILTFSDSTIGTIGKFVGIGNYIEAFANDKMFFKSLTRTFYYVLVFVPLSLIFSITVAMMLNQKIKGKAFFRVAFYIPYITSGVAVTLLWGWIFNPSFGLLNYALSRIGITGPNWLGDANWSMPAIIIMNLWTQGNNIIIFLAGLQNIPEQIYESAKIDGANWLHRTFNITLPLLSPTTFFCSILGFIGAFQMFMQPYVLTEGGPKDSTYVFMLHIYNQAFRYGRMGYACTLAWIMLVIIMCITLINIGLSRRWVYYSEE